MLAEPAPEPFDSDEHLFEPKWDGYRCLAFLDRDAFPRRGMMLQSRRGADLTARFPELAALGARPWRRTILDGELLALRGGRADFYGLARRLGLPDAAGAAPPEAVVLVVFDMLMERGEELVRLPLVERRARLERCLREAGAAGLALSPAVAGCGRALYRLALAHGLEGVVAKRASSPYLPGRRSPDWLKVRRRQELDCVIGGVAPGAVAGFGSFLVGAYADPGARRRGEPLRYLGHVGSGLGAAEVARVLARLRPRATPPFAEVPRERAQALWVEPELVCRVEFQEITPAGRLRHPVYRGLREDKSPDECVLPPVPRGGGGLA